MNENILKISTNENEVSILLNKTPTIQTFQTKSNGDIYNIKISIKMDESSKQLNEAHNEHDYRVKLKIDGMPEAKFLIKDIINSTLNKIKEENEKDEYYISVDYGRNNSTKATLFRKNNKGLKIIKFIAINENTVDKIAEGLINEIKPYRNGKILIENIGCGISLIDQIESKGFNNIIKLDLKDMNASKINSVNLVRNNDNIHKLMSGEIKQNTQQLIEFIELVKELNNLEIRMSQYNIVFAGKLKEIGSSRIQTVFQILSKLNYLL